MKIFSNESKFEKLLITAYFLLGLVQVVCQIFGIVEVQFLIKPLLIILLSILYWYTSEKKNLLFFINLGFLLIGRLFFIPNEFTMLFYALIAIFFHRIIEIYYVSKLIKLNDLFPPVLASIPFLVFFLYLSSFHETVIIKSFLVLISHIILISILSGIILSHYLLNSVKNDVWLLIFGIMSLVQTFIVFIEKFYLDEVDLLSLRPLALVLNMIISFSFYKFVIAMERLNKD